MRPVNVRYCRTMRGLTPRLFALSLVALTVVVPALGFAASAAPPATVSVSETTASPGTVVRVPVTLDSTPTGLQQYRLTVAVDNPGVANVRSVEAGDVATTFDVVSSSNRRATVRVADIADTVDTGDGAVTLAVVVVEPTAPGTTTVDVTVERLRDDDGEDRSTTVRPGTLTVAGSQSLFTAPLPGSNGVAAPADLDGDGRYEDVDGDGDVDFDDAIALAFSEKSDLSDAQRAALDFDRDGDADFADAIELSFQV
ncbi:MAG: hypothetical protein ACQETI_01020 [Halobacteriota archaeon]